jgi:hypothetical protein
LHVDLTCLSTPSTADWRIQQCEKQPYAVLSTCQERKSETSSLVLIPYDRVRSSTCVSASILWIQFDINRFLWSEHNGRFETASIDLFVSNCPAEHICDLLMERRFFFPLRGQLQPVMHKGVLEEEANDSIPSNDPTGRLDRIIPVTESLSAATALFSEIDLHSQSLASELQLRQSNKDQVWSANDQTLTTSSFKFCSDKDRGRDITVRLCRLRLYSAALLGAGLVGAHRFTRESVLQVIEKDLQRAHSIVQESAVLTALNRVEFLLDTAEKRLRDAAICGWKYRDSSFTPCVELFLNAYFSETIALLSEFFDYEKLTQVKVSVQIFFLFSALVTVVFGRGLQVVWNS